MIPNPALARSRSGVNPYKKRSVSRVREATLWEYLERDLLEGGPKQNGGDNAIPAERLEGVGPGCIMETVFSQSEKVDRTCTKS